MVDMRTIFVHNVGRQCGGRRDGYQFVDQPIYHIYIYSLFAIEHNI